MLNLYDLWEKVLIAFSKKDEKLLNQLQASKYLDRKYAEDMRTGIIEALFLDAKATKLSYKTLQGHHEYYASVKPIIINNQKIKAENKNKAENQQEPQADVREHRLSVDIRHYLEAYSRQLPENEFLGSFVSYQFALEGKKLDLVTELGKIETFVATRMIWILIPKSERICRVIGLGSNGKRYEGEGTVVQGHTIQIKACDIGAPDRIMQFTMANDNKEVMTGYQTLFELNVAPSNRKIVWKRETPDFEDLTRKEGYQPCFFQNIEDLPEEYQEYVEQGVTNAVVGDPHNYPQRRHSADAEFHEHAGAARRIS